MHDRCTRVEDRKIEDPREEEAAARNSVESLIPRLAHRNANFPYRVTGPLANAGWVTVEFQTRGEHPFLTSGSVDITASLGFTSSRFLRDIVASHDEHDATLHAYGFYLKSDNLDFSFIEYYFEF